MTTNLYTSQMQTKVEEFHSKYGLVQCGYSMMDAGDWITRLRLISEEVSELFQAVDEDNILDIVDAIGDLLYVTFAVAVAMKIDIEPIFNEIHRSNMTKDGGISAGKIQKGPGFEAPQLVEILQEQGVLR